MITPATMSDAIVTVPSSRYWNSEYTNTSSRPMSPAMRPLCSWVVPSVAEIESMLSTVKPTGSAPNLS